MIAARAIVVSGIVAMVVVPSAVARGVDGGASAKVTVTLKPATVAVGRTAHVKGAAAPAAPGQSVRLQQRVGGDWKSYRSQRLTRRSTYDFALKFASPRVLELRVASSQAVSRSVKLTVVKLPGMPTNLSAVVKGTCSNAIDGGGRGGKVTFSWKRPTAGGPVIGYSLSGVDNFSHPRKSGGDFVQFVVRLAKGQTSNVECLDPGEVEWSVAAYNAGGQGQYPPNKKVTVP